MSATNSDRKKRIETILPDFGKVPPQAIEVEEAVIGAAINEGAAIDEVADFLTPDMFYKDANRITWEAILKLYRANKIPDVMTLMDELRNNGNLETVGGIMRIMDLTMKVVSAARIGQHALIVKAKWIQREMIRISQELQNRAFEDTYDPGELIEFAEKELFKVGDITQRKEAIPIGTLLNNLADLISKRCDNKNKLLGAPSGIVELDRVTMGWQGGDLVILASRPSMGKTALAIQFAGFAAKMNKPTLMFSLEMTDIQLGERYITTESGIDSYDIKTGNNISWPLIERAVNANRNVPLYIDDSAKVSIYEFRSKVRRAKKKYGIELVICDYLNLFTGDKNKGNMSEEYGSISKMFKAVAKECKVAVIALAQLNRSPDNRAIMFPKLSDLRNSGEIEQDADIVIFPVRYKAIGQTFLDGRDVSDRACIDVAKNRNGMTRAIEVRVSKDCMKWGIPEDDFAPNPDAPDADGFIEPMRSDEQLKF